MSKLYSKYEVLAIIHLSDDDWEEKVANKVNGGEKSCIIFYWVKVDELLCEMRITNIYNKKMEAPKMNKGDDGDDYIAL